MILILLVDPPTRARGENGDCLSVWLDARRRRKYTRGPYNSVLALNGRGNDARLTRVKRKPRSRFQFLTNYRESWPSYNNDRSIHVSGMPSHVVTDNYFIAHEDVFYRYIHICAFIERENISSKKRFTVRIHLKAYSYVRCLFSNSQTFVSVNYLMKKFPLFLSVFSISLLKQFLVSSYVNVTQIRFRCTYTPLAIAAG